MFDRQTMKAATESRTTDWSICAVRVGEGTWLQCSHDPEKLENRLEHMLRRGAKVTPAMSDAFLAGGKVSVVVLERLDRTLTDITRRNVANKRLDYWSKQLDAPAI